VDIVPPSTDSAQSSTSSAYDDGSDDDDVSGVAIPRVVSTTDNLVSSGNLVLL